MVLQAPKALKNGGKKWRISEDIVHLVGRKLNDTNYPSLDDPHDWHVLQKWQFPMSNEKLNLCVPFSKLRSLTRIIEKQKD